MQNIYFFIIATFVLLAGCGGGTSTDGSSGAATTYKVTLATEGVLTVGPLTGIGVTLQLPTGVTPKLAADGTIDISVVKASGVLANNASKDILTNYIQATGTTAGILSFVLASTAPFGIGEFATVTLNKAARDVNFATVNQNIADGTMLTVVKDYEVKSSSAVFMNYSTAVNTISIKISAALL